MREGRRGVPPGPMRAAASIQHEPKGSYRGTRGPAHAATGHLGRAAAASSWPSTCQSLGSYHHALTSTARPAIFGIDRPCWYTYIPKAWPSRRAEPARYIGTNQIPWCSEPHLDDVAEPTNTLDGELVLTVQPLVRCRHMHDCQLCRASCRRRILSASVKRRTVGLSRHLRDIVRFFLGSTYF